MLVYLNKKATRVCQGIFIQHSESQIYQVSRRALMDRMLSQCVKVPRYLCLNLQLNIAMIPTPNGDGTELVTSLAHKVSKILLVALKCLDITTI